MHLKLADILISCMIGLNYVQENAYNMHPAMNTSIFKFEASEPGCFSYYECGNDYVVNNHSGKTDEYRRRTDYPSGALDDQATVSHVHQEGNASSTSHANPIEGMI